MDKRPAYYRVLATFARNSLVRDMMFRSNFLIEAFSSVAWTVMNLGFYVLIFQFTEEIGRGTGWGQYEFFVFISAMMIINSIVQAFFMPNAQEFSELIRTGGLDFALLKPVVTQFLISLQRIHWSSLSNIGVGFALMFFSFAKMAFFPSVIQFVLFPIYVACGVAILYSIMFSLAATSIWLGRNQTLYNFWFYITNFSRYPMEIYGGSFAGDALRGVFTFVVPVLIAINVPAQLMAWPLAEQNWWLVAFALVATAGSLAASRWIFQRALLSYRSASS